MLTGIRVLAERNDTPPTQVNLAEYNNVDVMSVSQIVRRLARAGLVARERHPNDTRAWVLSLTNAGERTLADAAGAADRLHESFFAGCDQPTLRAALRDLLNADAVSPVSTPVEN